MSHRLSAVLIGGIAAISFAQMASAADLPRKAPAYMPPPPPVYSWTGCYVGLNAGGVWGTMHDDWTPIGPLWIPPVASSLQANGSTTLDASGFTGGGQVGCNYQLNQFVFGAEADIQYTGLDESRDLFVPASGGVTSLNIHNDFRSRWLATFRGRLGWLVNPTVLIYGTGGLALANVETTDSVINAANPAEFVTASGSTTRAGWTVGGGVEWKFAPQWSLKAEYLYVDLGTFSTTGADTLFPTATINHDHHLTENIGRVGVNYHF